VGVFNLPEEESEQEQLMKAGPYLSPMNTYGGSIITLTNPQDELHKMELTLRSMSVDKNGNQTQVGDPLMNELGINSVIGMAQTILSRVTIMSDLNKNEIPMLIDFLGDTLAKDLMMGRIKYEIETATARDKIYFTVLTSTFICMKRAFESGDRRFWKGSQQDITHRIENNQQRPSMMSRMFGWGK